MIFDKIKFYIKDIQTGELKITFLCDDCKTEMEKPFYSFFRTYSFNNQESPGYHFYCEKCWKKKNEIK